MNFWSRDLGAGATGKSRGGVGVVRGGFFVRLFFCGLTVAARVHPRTCALEFRPHTILLSVGLRGLSADAPGKRGGGVGVFFGSTKSTAPKPMALVKPFLDSCMGGGISVAAGCTPRTCALVFRRQTCWMIFWSSVLGAGAPISRAAGVWVVRGVFFVRFDVLNLS